MPYWTPRRWSRRDSGQTHLDDIWTQTFAVSDLLDLVHVLFQVEIEELEYEVELGF